LPDAANGALPGRPGAGIIANDYGVYRPFDPVTGVITIQTWLMPAEAESDVALGLVFGPSQHEWERILRRAEGGDWLYRSGYGEGPLPNTRSKSVTVTITYRTADGTYDMSLDGYPVITNASLVSEFAGRPVEGVFLRSGSSFQGRRTYFDELSVIHRPEDRRGRLASVHVPPRAQPRETTPRIRILSASLNGQTTDLASPTFFVQEGAPIRGRVSFQIDNPHPDQASFPVVCVPTWGRHSSSYITATPDAPTGVSEMAVNLLLPAPPGPGTYHVIIAGVAETDPAHVALGTNWAGGDAVWNNDTDIASWGPELLDAAARDGAVTPPWLDSRSRRWRTEAGAAVIRVVVGESPSVVASKLGR
jgi:hypothetical protein